MIIYTIDADFGSPNRSGGFSWVTIYDPEDIDIGTSYADVAYNISLDLQMGSAGTLTFTIPVGHPNYDSFKVLKTTVKVAANNTDIWMGRVLSIKRDFLRNMTITCEGALSFLNDILARPVEYFHMQPEYVENEGWVGKPIKIQESRYGNFVLQDIMDNYNMWCSPLRHVYYDGHAADLVSMVVASYPGISGYESTLSCINKLLDCDTNAMISWRLVDDQDWGECAALKIINVVNAFPSGTGEINLTSNLTDYQSSIDGGDIYTQIVPFDKNKKGIETASSANVPPDAYQGSDVGDYGVIEKVYNYPDEDVDGSLFDAAYEIMTAEDIKNLSPPDELTLNAVDLGLTDSGSGMIFPGYSYLISSSYHSLSARYNCVAAKINLDEPGAASYTFLLPEAGYKLKIGGITGLQMTQDTNNQAITTKAEIFTEEAPERLVKIDDNHIVAVMNGRAEHYKISKFATDEIEMEGGETLKQDQYDLEIYETSVPDDLPPRPEPDPDPEPESEG